MSSSAVSPKAVSPRAVSPAEVVIWIVENAGSGPGSREARVCGQALGSDLRVALLDQERLGPYSPGRYAEALSTLIAREGGNGAAPMTVILLPHTYQVAEFAPGLAMRLGAAYVPSISGADKGGEGDGLRFRRSILQAKLQAEVRPRARTVVATVQSGPSAATSRWRRQDESTRSVCRPTSNGSRSGRFWGRRRQAPAASTWRAPNGS